MNTTLLRTMIQNRRDKVQELRAAIAGWQNHRDYSQEFKAKKIAELQEQLKSEDAARHNDITDAISNLRREAQKSFAEQPKDLAAEIRALRIQLENQELLADLLDTYSPNLQGRTELWNAARRAVSDGLDSAPAYIKALRKVDPDSKAAVVELEKQYAEAQETPEQKAAKALLAEVDEIANAYEAERIVEQMAGGAGTTLERIAAKNRLVALGADPNGI